MTFRQLLSGPVPAAGVGDAPTLGDVQGRPLAHPRRQKPSAGRSMTGSAPLSMRARRSLVSGSIRFM